MLDINSFMFGVVCGILLVLLMWMLVVAFVDR